MCRGKGRRYPYPYRNIFGYTSGTMERHFFESQASKFFNLGWEHGRYADYWSAVHVLTGLLLGALGLFFGFSLPETFITSAILAVLYECVEAALKVAEDIQNVLTDIVLVAVGPLIVFSLFPAIEFSRAHLAFFMCVLFLAELVLLRQGWNAYLKDALRKNRKAP